MKKVHKKIRFLLVILSTFLYALSNVFLKIASQNFSSIYNITFLVNLFIGGVILLLYGFVWQQTLKYYDLNIANSLKTLYLIWNILFSIIIFGERYYLNNYLGVFLIVLGVIVVNLDD